jgi:thiamine pyrophosphate-dependent acetolactate synthase large subunit-like protein
MTEASSGPASQRRLVEIVVEETPNAAMISNLGTASYDLMAVEDREKNFYLTNAMGVTTPTGLGVALGVDEPVTVLEGDGSLLMSLGTLATVEDSGPSNLTIVVLDNSTWETTGGQPTLSAAVDFAEVAKDCSLKSWHVDDEERFRDVYREAVAYDGPTVVSCDVETTIDDDRPRLDYGHSYTKHRFRQALTDS